MRALTTLRFSLCCKSAKGATWPSAHYQQLAVQDGAEIHCLQYFGEGGGDILGAARIDAAAALGRDKLHPNAVPFPFGAPIGGLQGGKVGNFQRMREHRRAEHRRLGGVRLGATLSSQANSAR